MRPGAERKPEVAVHWCAGEVQAAFSDTLRDLSSGASPIARSGPPR